MTQPERQLSAEAAHAADRGASGRAPSAAHDKSPKQTPGWEQIYSAASGAQQAELLALAKRQGLLYGHQLPQSMNGQPRDEVRRFLSRVFAGAAREIAPVRAAPFACADLDAPQRDAVARALATPDICLIQGLPATGKSKVAAEIVARATELGERVLLVAPRAASVDRVLELTQGRLSVCAVRCLGGDEPLEAVSEPGRSLVFSEQLRRLETQTQFAASQRLDEAKRRHLGLADDAAAWPMLLEFADRHERLLEQSREVARRREAVPEAVATIVARIQVSGTRESTELAAPESDFERDIRAVVESQNQSQTQIDQSLADCARRTQSCQDHLARLSAEENALAPLAEAKAGGRWWKWNWWRAILRGNVAARAADLQVRIRQGKEELARLENESAGLHSERRQTEEKARTALAGRSEREATRRVAEIDVDDATLASERSEMDAKRRDILDRLHPDTPRPASAIADVRAAMAQWQEILEAATQTRDSWPELLDALRQGPELLVNRLRSSINVVAATLTGLGTDPLFCGPGEESAFDLLVVDHAESISEAEFMAVARCCRRWVLIAETTSFDSEPLPDKAHVGPRLDRRSTKPAAPTFFRRLWAALHCDPSRLPYVWAREPDKRLCCRLRPVSSEQRRWLEIERVADFHDIELRIVAPPRGKNSGTDSFLAEVAFPPAMSLADAKAYIFRELEEVPVRAQAHSVEWLDSPHCLQMRLTSRSDASNRITAVPLAGGVRELIIASANGDNGGTDWFTHSLEFERAAGWERSQAEAWAAGHLGLVDLGRTALLKAPSGFASDLAAFLSDVLCADECRGASPRGGSAGEATVEFVPIPSLPRGGQRNGQHRPRLPNGAGLEADLADSRHRDRLPPELHARLEATRGFANYLEAQAVVRALLRLARERDNGFAPGRHPTGDVRSRNGASIYPLRIGVVALYPGQAQLIRLLLEPEAAALAAAGLDVRVDIPTGFHEQVYTIALVSLTRSHTHRAASLGDGPAALATALTRGRSRLIVFGDVGTLARRVEWQAPLDHLDEAASLQERTVVDRLLRYIQGEGKHQYAFRLRHDGAYAGAASPRGVPARRPVGREGSNA